MSDGIMQSLYELRNMVKDRFATCAYRDVEPVVTFIDLILDDLNDILALEAPAQPLDELRSVTPATEEASGDQFEAPEIPAGFTKWEGGVYGDFVKQNPDLNYTETEIEVLFRDGNTFTGLSGGFLWNHTFEPDDIIAYRIIPEPSVSEETLPGIDDIIDPDLTGGLQTEEYLERLHAGTLTADEPTSVLDDPELQAAVDRANASIAQDEPRAEYDRALPNGFVAWGGVSLDPSGRPEDVGPDFTVDVIYRDGERPFRLTGAIASALSWDHMSESRSSDIIAYRVIEESPQPYVGCIDEELERDYDAAKARTTIQPDAEKKTFFAFLGAKPKPEEVC